MKNKKVILSSILSLVLCLGLIAGGTFALFTGKVETNIAVTAANIELTAAIDNDTVKTKTWGTDYVDGKDGISIDADVAIDGANITLNNIIPGDGVTFEIAIANNSTIGIQYRVVVENKDSKGELNGLVVTVGNNSYDGRKAVTEWTAVASPKGEIANIPVTIEFPDADDNDLYQGAETKLVVRVEAVQGGATVANTVCPSTQEGVNDAISSASKDEPIEVDLPTGNYTLPSMSDKDVTFTGTKDTTIDMKNAVTTSGSLVTFDGVTIVYDNEAYEGLQHSEKEVYKNCTIKGTMFLYAPEVEFINCTFEMYDETTEYSVWTYGATDVTFTNCTFNTNGKAVLVYNESATNDFVANITLNGCAFYSNGKFTGKAAVEAGQTPYGQNTYNFVFNNCSQEGFAANNSTSALWGNKNSMDTDHLNVVIDGADVY